MEGRCNNLSGQAKARAQKVTGITSEVPSVRAYFLSLLPSVAVDGLRIRQRPTEAGILTADLGTQRGSKGSEH